MLTHSMHQPRILASKSCCLLAWVHTDTQCQQCHLAKPYQPEALGAWYIILRLYSEHRCCKWAYILGQVQQDVANSHAAIQLPARNIVVQHLHINIISLSGYSALPAHLLRDCQSLPGTLTFFMYSAEKLGCPAMRSSAMSSSLKTSYTLMNSCSQRTI